MTKVHARRAVRPVQGRDRPDGRQGHRGDVHDADHRAQQGARDRARTWTGEKNDGEQAQEKIIALSTQIAKERGISLSDAVKLAGAQLASESEAYREHYANAVVSNTFRQPTRPALPTRVEPTA